MPEDNQQDTQQAANAEQASTEANQLTAVPSFSPEPVEDQLLTENVEPSTEENTSIEHEQEDVQAITEHNAIAALNAVTNLLLDLENIVEYVKDCDRQLDGVNEAYKALKEVLKDMKKAVIY